MDEEILRQFSLDGRIAVVTGAAAGIGQETARVLALAGASVMAADIDDAGLEGTLREIQAEGGNIRGCRTDVSDRTAMEALAGQAESAFGRIDIWVNAAGLLIYRPIIEVTPEDLQKIMAVNLNGAYWGCAAAAQVMRQNAKGSIINISSTGADAPAPGLSLYSITKSAVNMLTRAAATEFGPYGIRVNTVAPGFVDTQMVTYRYRDASGNIDPVKREEVLKARSQGSPLGTIGTTRDIALAVLYLASDASRFVTGQILRPNGGVTMP